VPDLEPIYPYCVQIYEHMVNKGIIIMIMIMMIMIVILFKITSFS